ncbi:transposase [Mucilaginibacter terrae]|uniref:REP-associated tyrosine transposase n=1 Tax=Mucilaginibacter terrae TaxID=1955052 RepID=UPI0036419B6B
MSEFRKANTYRPFFVTLSVVGWIDVFTRAEYCEEVIKNLEYCRKHKGLKIYAYCIMSSHIHLIVAHDESRLPNIIRDFKSFTAKQIIHSIINNPTESRKEWLLYLFKFFAAQQSQNSEYQFWQKTIHPTELITAPVFEQKVDYIHHNPVAAGLVTEATTYKYSSACFDSPLVVDES